MKVALITGGSRGIGRSMVEEFSAAGFSVAFTYATNAEAARALVAQISEKGVKAMAFLADVRNFSLARDVVEETRSTLGSIDVLINNAGIRRDRELTKMDPEIWREVIETNLNGAFHYTRACVEQMMLTGGVILNVASAGGVTGAAGQTHYATATAGLIGFTRALAKEVSNSGVRVNAIAPGYFDTDMIAPLEESTRKKVSSQVPPGKAGQPGDVARLAVYLAGDEARQITGKIFTMNGGPP